MASFETDFEFDFEGDICDKKNKIQLSETYGWM